MNYDLINRIAKKMILSFKSKGFFQHYSNQIDTGIVIYNYFNFPVACGYKKGKDYFILTCYNSKESYEKFRDSLSKKSIAIFNYLEKNGFNINNYCKKIKEIFQKTGITEKDDFIVKSVQKMDFYKFRETLFNDYDIDIKWFNEIFGQNNQGINIFKFGNFTFKSPEKIDKKLIKNLCEKLNNLLPENLKSQLFYGDIQLKNSFKANVAALWTHEDYIILSINSLKDITLDFIHELSHRWFYKFASKQQIGEFKKLYDNANGKDINIEEADIVTFKNDDTEYIYVGIDENGQMLLQGLDTELSYHRKINIRDFDTINGQKIQKYDFPSNYSKTNFSEFVAECISYCYCNKLSDKKLKSKIKSIMENIEDE